MGKDIATKENAVPGLAGLAAGLRRTKATMPSFGGKGFLKFGKDGQWVLGKNSDSLNGDRVLFNVNTLKSGFVCWTNHPADSRKKNEKLGEEMKLATMGGVDITDLPDLGWEWKQQQAIEGRFMTGDQEEFSFTTSSLGGLEAMDTILDAIMGRIDDDEEVFLFPVVELSSDHYEHKQWGKTYKPILDIVGWADVEGLLEGEAKKVSKKSEPEAEEPEAEEPEAEEPEAEEEAAPVRRRRRG